jgi:hypothetical protein
MIEEKRGNIPAALDSAADVHRKAGVPLAPLLLDQGEVLLSAGLAGEARREQFRASRLPQRLAASGPQLVILRLAHQDRPLA